MLNREAKAGRAAAEREAVKRNMERATETAPAELRDEANESKVVFDRRGRDEPADPRHRPEWGPITVSGSAR